MNLKPGDNNKVSRGLNPEGRNPSSCVCVRVLCVWCGGDAGEAERRGGVLFIERPLPPSTLSSHSLLLLCFSPRHQPPRRLLCRRVVSLSCAWLPTCGLIIRNSLHSVPYCGLVCACMLFVLASAAEQAAVPTRSLVLACMVADVRSYRACVVSSWYRLPRR